MIHPETYATPFLIVASAELAKFSVYCAGRATAGVFFASAMPEFAPRDGEHTSSPRLSVAQPLP